jgi:hypothetical protein
MAAKKKPVAKKKVAPKKQAAPKKQGPATKKAAPKQKPVAKAKASPLRATGRGGIEPVVKPPPAPPSREFLTLVAVFTERPGVDRARMMGCEGLRVGGKYFAYEWRGDLVVKLPRDTVESYVASGHGTPFDPGMGRPMKEWLTIPPGHADWRNLAEQAFTFVAASL